MIEVAVMDVVEILKALGDGTRLRILHLFIGISFLINLFQIWIPYDKINTWLSGRNRIMAQ